jgi:hypothetical protein
MGKLLAERLVRLFCRIERDGCPRVADFSRCVTGSKVHRTFSRVRDSLVITHGAYRVCVLLNHRSFPSVGSSLTRSWRKIAITLRTEFLV